MNFSPDLLFLVLLGAKLGGGEGQGNRGNPLLAHGCRAGWSDMPTPGTLAGRQRPEQGSCRIYTSGPFS